MLGTILLPRRPGRCCGGSLRLSHSPIGYSGSSQPSPDASPTTRPSLLSGKAAFDISPFFLFPESSGRDRSAPAVRVCPAGGGMYSRGAAGRSPLFDSPSYGQKAAERFPRPLRPSTWVYFSRFRFPPLPVGSSGFRQGSPIAGGRGRPYSLPFH